MPKYIIPVASENSGLLMFGVNFSLDFIKVSCSCPYLDFDKRTQRFHRFKVKMDLNSTGCKTKTNKDKNKKTQRYPSKHSDSGELTYEVCPSEDSSKRRHSCVPSTRAPARCREVEGCVWPHSAHQN